MPNHSNSLIHESSPYLLQHAHNPVNWYAWNNESLSLAEKENKPIIVSIGYSACHWCHVMEHESFEDQATARIMNEHFINIKVDREERPDIDQIYMNAVQLISGQGGWPLNCFILPDGRPFYGGTYFQKQQWQNIMLHIAELWKNERNKLLEYAEELTKGVIQSELFPEIKEDLPFSFDLLHQTVNNWKQKFDPLEGGPNRAPKFPLPNNYLFLLRYAHITGDKKLREHIDLTLRKMAFGGIYDQLGGGFARYSTDMLWKVPHFEKMLYDNAQLISLYAEAFRSDPREGYKEIVYDTIDFIERELCSPEGAFYSALDADSQGQEGKYYVWTREELQSLLGSSYQLASQYYNINSKGYWEDGNYILLRTETDEELSYKLGLEPGQLKEEIVKIKETLFNAREKRSKPSLDDKTLSSWNALMLQGLTDAYKVFKEPRFLQLALKNAEFILNKQVKPDGGLYHTYKKGKSSLNGFLEDYAFLIESFISLYQCNWEEKWLYTAKKLMDYCILHFYDSQTGLFYFTSDTDQALITRKRETSDNVIPASCSSIDRSLFALGRFFGNSSYSDMSEKMLRTILPQIPAYGAGYSNWCILLLQFISPFYEVAILGKDAFEIKKLLENQYLPNVIFAGSEKEGTLPILMNRYVEDKTKIYVCEKGACMLPVESVNEALYLLKKGL